MCSVRTSTTGLGALRPALQSPLKGVQLFLDNIIAADGGHRVLVDDVLVGQAGGAGDVLLRDDLAHMQHGRVNQLSIFNLR